MGMKQNQFKKILNIVEQKRLKNQHILAQRKQKLFKELPRLQEIEGEIASESMRITREIIKNPGEREAYEVMMKRTVDNLKKEREKVLVEAGYGPGYLQPIFDCEICEDTGFVDGEKCQCLRREMINHAYNQSNLKDVLDQENFDTFSLTYYSEEATGKSDKSPRDIAERNYKACLNFANNFGQQFGNLILHGQAGLGKTFLCNAIAKSVLDQGKSVIYMTAFNLFRMIENYRFHNEEGQITQEDLEAIYECDLLIIDDLGTEINNAFTTSELFSLINSRLLESRPVVISTNLSPSGWTNQYSDRIVSRIYGNYLSLGFVGSDIRLKKRLEKV